MALASRLRPDIALLGVMEAGPGPADELARVREQLAVEKIEFELLTTDQYSAEDNPYLPAEDEG